MLNYEIRNVRAIWSKTEAKKRNENPLKNSVKDLWFNLAVKTVTQIMQSTVRPRAGAFIGNINKVSFPEILRIPRMDNTSGHGDINYTLPSPLSTFKFYRHVRRYVVAVVFKRSTKKQQNSRSSCLPFGACFSPIKFTNSADQGLTTFRWSRRKEKAKKDLASAGVKVSLDIISHHPISCQRNVVYF